ncbi:MAG TPA: hypothetical protein VKB75_10305 [Jatrophihabitans sp.]|nr:hypothetical protein [Jatrophihabitans sp.]
MTRTGRLLAFIALTAGLALATPASAFAHGASGQPIPDAAHYLTEITAVTPTVPGVLVRVDRRGEWIEVTNSTSQTLTVLGYFREPYLQVTSQGVQENVFSASLQMNQSLFAEIPQTSASTLPPSWRQTSARPTARWHDHRIHWMSAQRPPNVKSDPGRRQLIGTWQVHLKLDTTPITVSGTLSWLPVKSSGFTAVQVLLLGLDAAALLAGAGAIALFAARRRRRQHQPTAAPVSPHPLATDHITR